ncbi:metalloregulator ArsR/SmtB family transcription factor [Bacillaceae bacterium S4-13-58]
MPSTPKDVCEVTCIHEDIVDRVKKELETKKPISVTSLFKALADENRLSIAYALSIEDELCVCDVANIIGASTATASHHLRHLRKLGIAKYRKVGKLVYYSLDDQHVRDLIQLAITHLEEVTNREPTN